ncbi:MAG: hypothetical protein IJ526_09920 [Lachnospiraceae bacterium]|nr:hypothetical protein [Lachnospiraceae bacterium]
MVVIKSGIIVILILTIRKACWKYISRRLQYSLWLLAVIYMLLGSIVSIPSTFAIENTLNDLLPVVMESRTVSNYFDTYSEKSQRIESLESADASKTQAGSNVDSGRINSEKNLESQISLYNRIKQSWQIIRIAGQIAFVMFFFISNLVFYFRCRNNRILYDDGSKVGLRIYLMDDIGSPFLFGRSIYLDSMNLKDGAIVRHMVVHEYAHYRLHDNIWVVVRLLCFALNWFNPFMWIANGYMKQDSELACDEEAISILGDDERNGYGHTLINVAKAKSNNHPITATTSMSGSMRKMRERINSISLTRRNNKIFAAIAVVCMFFVTGCSFTTEMEAAVKSDDVGRTQINPDDNGKDIYDEEVGKIPNPTVSSERDFSNDTSGNYYNSVKYYDGYYYFSDTEGLKKLDKDLNESVVIAEGNVSLGNVNDEYLYYMRRPVEGVNETGIFRISLATDTEEKLVSWTDDMWMSNGIYADQSVLYVGFANGCYGFAIGDSKTNDSERIPTEFSSDMGRCGITEGNAGFPFGFLNTYVMRGKIVVYVDSGIYVYDVETGSRGFNIDNCSTDILMFDKGMVYKDNEQNIHYIEWTGNDPIIIYSTAGGNPPVNYGTIDQDYLYGFIENDDASELVRISLDGKKEEIKRFPGVKKAVELGLSVNNGVLSYWDSGSIIFEDVKIN